MPKQPPNHVRYLSGIIKPAQNKSRRGFDCYLRVDGKDHRSRQPTLEAAKTWIMETEDATKARRPPLTALQLADAARAIAFLPAGYTLTDAAKAITGHVQGKAKPVALPAAVLDYLRARKAFVGRKTMAGYESTLNRLERHLGPVELGAITPAALDGFLVGMGPVTRNGNIRNLAAFFSWCVGQELVKASPVEKVERSRKQDTEIHVLGFDQAAQLIRTAATVKPAMVPYFALALFAGVRPEELARLPTGKVGHDFILIDGAVAKKKRRRTIPVRPNLRAWLDRYPPAGERIRFSRADFRAVVSASGLAWHPDVMRHTFATMAYSARPDAMEIAAQMGNSPTVFFDHYRALSAPGAGLAYFDIWPACAWPLHPDFCNAATTGAKKPRKSRA